MNQKNYENNKAFFALLRAGLFPVHGEGFMVHDSLFKDVDWEKIYKLSQEQSVQGVVLQGIDWFKIQGSKFNIPQGLLLQWIGEVQMIEQRNKEMNAFIADLIEKLQKNDIYALLVKGQGIAQCYEKHLWRCSGDVDLFLSDSNYEKAKKLLIPLASKVDPEGVYSKHQGMTIDSWVVELHGRLTCGLTTGIDKQIDKVQDAVFYGGEVRCWQNGETQVFLPSADNDVIFVFTHFLKHFYKGGLGLRQICDWTRLLWTYHENINVDLLEKRLCAMGLTTEWNAFGAFAVEYLGMPIEAMPFLDGRWKMEDGRSVLNARMKKKADRICDFILEVGNMGHNRDSSYFEKYPYVIRKVFSLGRRISDLTRHARIFPLDSLRFFPRIMWNGVRSAIRGE